MNWVKFIKIKNCLFCLKPIENFNNNDNDNREKILNKIFIDLKNYESIENIVAQAEISLKLSELYIKQGKFNDRLKFIKNFLNHLKEYPEPNRNINNNNNYSGEKEKLYFLIYEILLSASAIQGFLGLLLSKQNIRSQNIGNLGEVLSYLTNNKICENKKEKLIYINKFILNI